MIELRQNTSRNITVGPILTKITRLSDPLVPIPGALLSQCTMARLIRFDGTSVNVGFRTWYAVPDCAGFYTLPLASSDVNTLGSLYLYVYNQSVWERPVVMEYEVISQNVWDSKYSSRLLRVELEAQKG